MKLIAMLLALAAQLAAEVPAEWAAIARGLPILSPASIIYDRPPGAGGMDDRALTAEERELAVRFWKLAKETPEPDVWKLVEERDAKVRTLALCAAFLQGNPKRLPDLHRFAKDAEPTFPKLRATSAAFPFREDAVALRKQMGTEQQTVGDFARRFVEIYLRASGHWGSFEDYWQARKDREHCIGWFKVALDRAAQGRITPPLSPEGKERVAKVRAQIVKLPPRDRAWTLISLAEPSAFGDQDAGPQALATVAELKEAARVVGREEVLRLFERKLVSGDPDIRLSQQSQPFGYGQYVIFFLTRGEELLLEEDADRLLAFEAAHREHKATNAQPYCVTPWWAICASRIAPDRSPEILRAAFGRFADGASTTDQDHRCMLVQEMCRKEGEKAHAAADDWVFRDRPERTAFGFGRHRFARWLGETKNAALIAHLIRDPRAADLDFTTLQYLAHSANALSAPRVIFAPEAIERVEKLFFDGTMGGTPKIQPEKAAALRQELAKWREAVARL